ncbi:hypothetical protein BKA66DRAFT_418340 [Pyrenochaeta sp. MPI-SDFR-AT-0127]|nr:hypothetical protein BKA66DRAFT_418340 [Pyrenochaeta sp. MPI-SDFR-AT-0127]
MSADLFAEFGTNPSSNQKPQSGSAAQPGVSSSAPFSFFDGLSSTPTSVTQSQPQLQTQTFQSFTTASNQATENDENDDWGDFEGGSSLEPDPFAFDQPQSTQETWQKAPIVKAKKSADPSVLFDAEEEFDEDDDFGDFEGTEEPKPPPVTPAAGSSALNDLIGDLIVTQNEPTSTRGRDGIGASRVLKSAGLASTEPGIGFGTTSKAKKPSKATALTAQKDEDGWDTFDDWEASIPTKAATNLPNKSMTAKATIDTETSVAPAPILSPTTDNLRPGELPPTNVPPPGVLLSLFPSLFAEAQETLFKPMAAQTLPMRNKLLAEAATITYLQGYLILANVAAHIIAGRKLRWKRDQHLSQGMRIGPASSKSTSGMKLAGIDKGENMKEEREVSDVVRVWKGQVGRLRHIVSGANQIKAGTLSAVPDLQETLPVKTLKQSEGGIPARQPCMMCGLKRDERVTATDMAVDDSFGEWWIEQVNMHRGCRNFWNEHQETLRQR